MLSIKRALQRFPHKSKGAVAIYFALASVVFIGMAGLAIDLSRAYLVKARLSQALDAAALAGGRALQTANDPDRAKVRADAQAFFDANFPAGTLGATIDPPSINITGNNTVVTVSSNAVIPTTLMRIFGVPQMTIAGTATASRAANGLDIVFAFDVSGSMCRPCAKIDALKRNANALVDSLNAPFAQGLQRKFVTVNGQVYSLLNIGVVPWSSKVNVRTHGMEGTTGNVTAVPVAPYQDPTGRVAGSRTSVYRAASSQVPLLYDPNTILGGWSGCVFARYTDKDSNEQDDITLGTDGTWPAWEPVPNQEGEPQPGGRSCNAADWNAGRAVAADGTPRPNGWPNPPSPRHSEDCPACPQIGILPLQSDPSKVKSMINQLQANGATIASQGLFWGWEVLMPGEPFDQAVVNPPFPRTQAIIFMTDGLNEGENGDAYHGWFGDGPPAGNITSKGDMTMPDGTQAKNNPDNRLLALAAKIKGSNPTDAGAVKIYVIQYQEPNPKLTGILKAVATQPRAPYYFFAPDETALASIFDQIVASLSALRLTQ